MKINHLYIFLLLSITCCYAIGQGNVKADPVAGTWKGSSLCQVKDSPCHDEVAIYHATKLTPTTYQFQMNKMVNGQEVEMGALVFTWNEKQKTLVGTNKSSRGTGTWLFHLEGSQMRGTLTIDGKTLFRIIDLQKE